MNEDAFLWSSCNRCHTIAKCRIVGYARYCSACIELMEESCERDEDYRIDESDDDEGRLGRE